MIDDRLIGNEYGFGVGAIRYEVSVMRYEYLKPKELQPFNIKKRYQELASPIAFSYNPTS